MLGRDTAWRQGYVLSEESASALVSDIEKGERVIVVTHDCDLSSDAELFVEVIIAKNVLAINSDLTNSKNPRRLHITFENCQDFLELHQFRKRSIDRSDFESSAVQDPALLLTDRSVKTLKQWLASRYGRPAFPNAFELRLRKNINSKTTVEKKIGKIMGSESTYLIGLFIDFGDQRGVELECGNPYAISILVIYDASEGGRDARKAAEKKCDGLRELFESAYGKPEEATEIALDNCEAISDVEMTLADVRRTDQWRLEYVSLDSDDSQDTFFPAGQLPG